MGMSLSGKKSTPIAPVANLAILHAQQGRWSLAKELADDVLNVREIAPGLRAEMERIANR